MFSRTHYLLEILPFLSNVINYNDIFLPKCNYSTCNLLYDKELGY